MNYRDAIDSVVGIFDSHNNSRLREFSEQVKSFVTKFENDQESFINLEENKVNILNYNYETLTSKEYIVIPFSELTKFVMKGVEDKLIEKIRSVGGESTNLTPEELLKYFENDRAFSVQWLNILKIFWSEISIYGDSRKKKVFLLIENPLILITYTGNQMSRLVVELFNYIPNLIIKHHEAINSLNFILNDESRIVNLNIMADLRLEDKYEMEFLVSLTNKIHTCKFQELGAIFKSQKKEIISALKSKQNDISIDNFVNEFIDWYKFKMYFPEELLQADNIIKQLQLLKTLKAVGRDLSHKERDLIIKELEEAKAIKKEYTDIVSGIDLKNPDTIPSWVESVIGPESLRLYLKERYQFDLDTSAVAFLKQEEKEKEIRETKKTLKEKLRGLDTFIGNKIIGQDEIIKPISSIIKRWFIGLRSDKPIGSLLMVGPTGVGKTETAKVLAEELFDGNLITLDMSEYQTQIDASKIIGIAPGYVGYDEGSGLLDKIRMNPRCVVLFDELEKAHPKVFDLFLQLLDEGRLTDNKGEEVSFKECLIIATTNAMNEEIRLESKNRTLERKDIIDILYASGSFRKELLARFSDIIKYEELSTSVLGKIFDQKLEIELKQFKNLKDLNIDFKFDFGKDQKEAIKDFIISKIDKSLGARELVRSIQENITGLILDKLVEAELEEVSSNESYIISLNNNKIIME